MRRIAGTLAALALLSCAPEPQPARPAFWQVTAPDGRQAWLLGTIHALDRPADWRSPAIDAALAGADSVVVEVSAVGDAPAMAAVFARLAQSPGLPPLSQRVAPGQRPALARLLDKAGMAESAFARTETWAAALTLARAAAPDKDAGNGIDRAVLAAAGDKPVAELEGTAGQLGLFDALPEAEQRDLLAEVIRDAGRSGTADLAAAWRRGDIAAIEAETRRGMLADPELREALFTARNRRWAASIAARMARGARPFVAVGAAHMAGPDGLPALLAAQGYTVTRLQ
jgi:uncharacterized protein YbaP (TraB family)